MKAKNSKRDIHAHSCFSIQQCSKKHYNQILKKKQLKIFTSLSQNEEKQKKV